MLFDYEAVFFISGLCLCLDSHFWHLYHLRTYFRVFEFKMTMPWDVIHGEVSMFFSDLVPGKFMSCFEIVKNPVFVSIKVASFMM